MARRALARINLAAAERNTARLRATLSPGTELCASVKGRASGHGMVPIARAALAGGATSLAVATAGEACELRAAGLQAPILVMGAVSDEELGEALNAGAELVAWDARFLDALARARPTGGRAGPVPVHVKLDTGMGRLGTRVMGDALALAERLHAGGDGVRLAGAMTHFATADERDDDGFFAAQLRAFEPFAQRLRGVRAHAANSAATLRDPASHFDMVRCGIALHGCDPFNTDPDAVELEPVLELHSYVAAVKPIAPGQSAGYGRRFVAERDTRIATVPLGYADAVRRDLTNNCDVLIDGRRYPLVGTVSMDNVTVDLGPDDSGRPAPPGPPVGVGDPVVLIGRSGGERQTVEDLANRVGTMAHEILCGISDRVTRVYHRDGEPVP